MKLLQRIVFMAKLYLIILGLMWNSIRSI